MASTISCLPVSLYPEFYSGNRTIPEWSLEAKKLGLDAIDINALFIHEKSISEISDIRQRLAVPVLMVCAYSDFTNPSEEKRAEAVECALQDLKRAKTIGARYLRLTAGQTYPDQKDDCTIAGIADCFRQCCDAADDCSVTILLENHSKPGAWTYPDYNFHPNRFFILWDALQQLPISINFDTANAFALGCWENILQAVSGRIATLHLNDLNSVQPLNFSRVGQGIVPMEKMLQMVYQTGFDGPVCIEEASFQGWTGLKDAVTYTKSFLQKNEYILNDLVNRRR